MSAIYKFFEKFFYIFYCAIYKDGEYKANKFLHFTRRIKKKMIEFLAKMKNIKDYKSKSSDRLRKIFEKQSKNRERMIT